MPLTDTQAYRHAVDHLRYCTGGTVSVATYSPGDGYTRYRLVPGPHGDYFADRELVTFLGRREATAGIRAFCAGYETHRRMHPELTW